MAKPPSARLVNLHEREAKLFARADLFDREGRSLILPGTRALNAVDLRDVAEGVQLRALGLVGHLPLTEAITLNLRPKFPAASLWYMLEIAGHSFQKVLPIARQYGRSDETPPHYLLARSFCFYLSRILQSGLERQYEPEIVEGYFKPKVDFGRTISKFVSRGDEVSTSSRLFSFSAHTRLNGHLKAACIRFLSIVPREAGWADEQLLLRSALDTMAYTAAVPPAPNLPTLTYSAPARVREAYVGAMTTYSILLGYTRVGFEFEASGEMMPSFLFSLEDVFEQFVRNILRSGLRDAGLGVADGNVPRNQVRLFQDNRQFPVKPDLIFRRQRMNIAAGEVKYKPRIEEADRYQLISHAAALGVTTAIWFSPAGSPAEAGMQYVGSLSTGTRFHHYKLDIGPGIRAASDSMVGAVVRLMEAEQAAND
ncbi:MAG TPA: hypothetical protein VF552_03540 [Allosphingosinicella sp.]